MAVPETVEAAVAVILRENGQVLLGQRPEGKPWAGWWEFPGGKIEAGETPMHALQRELQEELGIEAVDATPWLTRTFAYPERTVKLRFFTVRRWVGEPHGRENQQLSWQSLSALTVGPLLPANEPLIGALLLPSVYAITDLAAMGEQRFFPALQRALEHGLRLIQVRENQLDQPALAAFARRVAGLCRPYGARVLLNGEVSLARLAGVDGVHLSAGRLLDLQQKPEGLLCAASCHDEQELARAAGLGLDFVLLSPVLRTQSHPEATPLGWERFAQMLTDYPLPVYALGGLQPAELGAARVHGAHGIAMQRAAWLA
ncbi:8-oxo-dGTP diphosphatase [mine drainage metagenome]|uniref:8-oxo-dGTP diphosphatase n=1 Tax=mine drainage metagenome TaxID=410659 RepID=A0A1J5QAN3_9ZZZZ